MAMATAIPEQDSVSKRQATLATLANSNREEIAVLWQGLNLQPEYHVLKQPEIGMVMVQGRAAGNGTPFNMGEMTVTRSVIQLTSKQYGYGYTAGRDKDKSLLIALIDACHQVEAWQAQIDAELVAPLNAKLQQARSAHKTKVESTKVNFFTMVRGA